MKYLIVGLGNIGPEYEHTRHNVGFDILDSISEERNFSFSTERYGDVGRFRFKGKTLICLKPSTYMNRSGKAVRYWMQREKIPPNNLVVVVDDIHLELGRLRLRGKGGDGGHNGLNDIIQYLGRDYCRLRVGIGKDFQTGYQSDYVLGRWSAAEMETLEEVKKHASAAILSYVSIGLQRTMSQFNN